MWQMSCSRSYKMSKKHTIIFCLSLLVVGASCFFSGIHFHRMKMQEHFRKVARGGGEFLEKKMFYRLSKELDLSGKQVPQVKSILGDFFKRFDAIERRTVPMKRQNMLEMSSAFKQVLTPEQHEKYKEILKRSFITRLSQHKKFERRGPRGRNGEFPNKLERPKHDEDRPKRRGERPDEKPVLTDDMIIIEE